MRRLFIDPRPQAIAEYAWGVGYVAALLAVAKSFEENGVFPIVVEHHRNVALSLRPLNREAWEQLKAQCEYSVRINNTTPAKRRRKVNPAA